MAEMLYQAFCVPLSHAFFVKALIGGILVAVVSGVTGCLVILRRMSFLGDALSHAMIAGVAGGYLFMKLVFGIEAHAPAMLIGSLLAAIVTVALIGFVSGVSRIKEDTAIGIMYTGVFAAGVVLVSVFRNHIHIDLMHFIMGDVLGVAASDIRIAAIVTATVLTVLLFFFRQFQATAFDPIMAAAIGIPVVLVDYTLTTCVSLVVVSAVSMVGVILVVGLLITPAATAYLLSDRLEKMMCLAALFGITGVTGGLYLSYWIDASGGGAIMLFTTLQFLIVLVVAPEYGLLARQIRLYRMVPQEVLEDLLAALHRQDPAPVPPGDLLVITGSRSRQERGLRLLSEEGKIHRTDHAVTLTDTGRQEAIRIRRSHRIWEAYLAHAGFPEEAIHPKAHDLEHVHDPDALRTIDDLLGHPILDPHGQEIPQDTAVTLPGAIFAVSLLRPGQSAKIEEILPGPTPVPLRPGEPVTLLQREDTGPSWTLQAACGKTATFGHAEADRILVRFAPTRETNPDASGCAARNQIL